MARQKSRRGVLYGRGRSCFFLMNTPGRNSPGASNVLRKKAIPPGAKRPRAVRLFCVLFVSIPSDVYGKISGLNSIHEQALKRRKKESDWGSLRPLVLDVTFDNSINTESAAAAAARRNAPWDCPKYGQTPRGAPKTKIEKRSPRGVLYGRGAILFIKENTSPRGEL